MMELEKRKAPMIYCNSIFRKEPTCQCIDKLI
jgi:hypothetical protein